MQGRSTQGEAPWARLLSPYTFILPQLQLCQTTDVINMEESIMSPALNFEAHHQGECREQTRLQLTWYWQDGAHCLPGLTEGANPPAPAMAEIMQEAMPQIE